MQTDNRHAFVVFAKERVGKTKAKISGGGGVSVPK